MTSVNNYLSVYANAGFLARGEKVFRSMAVGDGREREA